MVTKRWIEFWVGIFVLLGCLALGLLALNVSGLTDFYQGSTGYKVVADFENIGGLKVRSRVSIAGVAIGRVTQIDYNPTNYMATVTMWLKTDANKIPVDSKWSILTAGFLGDNYIGIVPGFDTQYLVQDAHVPVENTTSSVVLEDLISRFFSEKASTPEPAKH